MRNLNFLQVVDAYRMVVALAGEKHLDKVSNNTQLDELARIVLGMLRQGLVGLAFWLAVGEVIRFPYTLRHFAERKMIEAAAHVPAGITVLQSPGQDLIQSRAGNDSELADLGYCARESPTGYACAHATLDDGRILAHAIYFLIAGRSRCKTLFILRKAIVQCGTLTMQMTPLASGRSEPLQTIRCIVG